MNTPTESLNYGNTLNTKAGSFNLAPVIPQIVFVGGDRLLETGTDRRITEAGDVRVTEDL